MRNELERTQKDVVVTWRTTDLPSRLLACGTQANHGKPAGIAVTGPRVAHCAFWLQRSITTRPRRSLTAVAARADGVYDAAGKQRSVDRAERCECLTAQEIQPKTSTRYLCDAVLPKLAYIWNRADLRCFECETWRRVVWQTLTYVSLEHAAPVVRL